MRACVRVCVCVCVGYITVVLFNAHCSSFSDQEEICDNTPVSFEIPNQLIPPSQTPLSYQIPTKSRRYAVLWCSVN